MKAVRAVIAGRLAGLPLGWRLVLVSVAVLIVILSVFGSILYSSLSATLFDTMANSMDAAAQTVVGAEVRQAGQDQSRANLSNRPPQAAGPSSGAAPYAHANTKLLLPPGAVTSGSTLFFNIVDLLTTPTLSASIIDPGGGTVTSGPGVQPFPTVPSPTLAPAIYRQVVATRQSIHLVVRTANGSVLAELIPMVQPTSSGFHVIDILQVNTSLQLADSLLGRLRLLLIAGTLLAAAATSVLTIPLIRAVLRPLRRMAATSRAIAGGDLSRRVPAQSSRDELADLADAFNEMVGQLVALLATQRRFLADASHELRTPLTALAGGLEMLLLNADRADPAARARLLRLMQGEAARMGRLVDDLLTLTRLDARNKEALTIGPVDLNALAAQVVDETRLLAPELDVTLEAPKDRIITVPGDADRLHQVLLNLCTNARAHTQAPGAITVSVGVADEKGAAFARLRVADTGEGIAASDLPHIWDRFYRADQARERHGSGGLGLGLAIVRAIIEHHGGSVEIASTLGVGTAVTVLLPLSAGAPSAPILQLALR